MIEVEYLHYLGTQHWDNLEEFIDKYLIHPEHKMLLDLSKLILASTDYALVADNITEPEEYTRRKIIRLNFGGEVIVPILYTEDIYNKVKNHNEPLFIEMKHPPTLKSEIEPMYIHTDANDKYVNYIYNTRTEGTLN